MSIHMESEYINRGELLAEIEKNFETIGANAERLVTRFPKANVEPIRRGKWIEFDTDMNAYSCSACNEPQMFIEGNPEQNQYGFCPHCGASMTERSGERE